MSNDTAPAIAPSAQALPLRALGTVLGIVAYLGGIGLLAASAARSLVRPEGWAPRLRPALVRRLDELLMVGLPLVGLIHVGFGSFLSMQAYFGATFTAASGAVVGLGLFRNVAPMLTGFALAGLAAVRITAELGGPIRPGIDEDPEDIPDRDVALGLAEDPRTPPDPARLVLVRVAASMLVGPVLVAWGATVGTLIGSLVCSSMLALPMPLYFGTIRQMIQPADVMGVVFKGMVYPGMATLIACHEAFRSRRLREEGRPAGAPPALRAVLISIVAILAINLSWFNLVYLSGSPFGPPVLETGP